MGVALVLAAALSASACGGGEPAAPIDPCTTAPESTLTGSMAAALDGALDQHFEGTSAPGVVAHVVVPGVGQWSGARGLGSVVSDEPMHAAAVFRVGSITKTLTAAAVIQLVEEGAWQLTAPVDDYVEGWNFGPEVTLERLLNHTSGIFNYTDDAGFLVFTKNEAEPAEVIDFALEHGQVFEPGSAWGYSNTGYFLLGLALESVENKSYHQILRDRLLMPGELDSLYMEQYEAGQCPVVQAHVGFGTSVTEGFSMSWAWAAGGLVGHVNDLCRWADQLLSGDVLTPASLELMKTENEHSAPPDRYALGLAYKSRGGRDVLGHTGSTMGFNGELFIDPASGTCVAVQTNDFFGTPRAVADPIWEALSANGY